MKKSTVSIFLLCISILLVVIAVVSAFQLKVGLDTIEEARKSHDASEDVIPGISVFGYVSLWLSYWIYFLIIISSIAIVGAIISRTNMKIGTTRAIRGISTGLFSFFLIPLVVIACGAIYLIISMHF